MHGHAWTIWPFVRDELARPRVAPGRDWTAPVRDPTLTGVTLRGMIHHAPGAEAIVVLVHGLAGCADSSYVLRAASLAEAEGFSTLRLNLRGADREGIDFYHAGLIDDLRAALGHGEVQRYRRRYLFGFSLGGHVSLRLAALDPGSVDAVAAVCSPLDLDASCRVIDSPRALLYRMHILRGLRDMARGVARHRPLPVGGRELRRIRTIREWDERVVAPRFGFASAEDYYRRASVAPLLATMETPSLIVAAEHDPMVAAGTLEGPLAAASSAIEVQWQRVGGHVGFPRRLELERRILGWLARA